GRVAGRPGRVPHPRTDPRRARRRTARRPRAQPGGRRRRAAVPAAPAPLPGPQTVQPVSARGARTAAPASAAGHRRARRPPMTTAAQSTVTVLDVPIEDLALNAANPRHQVTVSPELVQSIAAQGVLQPLLVADDGSTDGQDQYRVIAGHR